VATVVVIGGGPAGIMAAIAASDKNKVILLERNEKIGKKLYITGKGRCNITNSKDIGDFFEYIPGNPHFLYSSLYTFTNEDTMNMLSKLGVKLKVERGGRVFPESDKSSDIISAFKEELYKKNVDVRLNSRVKKIIHNSNHIEAVMLEDNTRVEGDFFILCTGGVSYPRTGSTGDGINFAKELGHNIIPIKPSLVPIEIDETWLLELQGLSLRNIELKIMTRNNKVLFSDFGEMLFTHFGITGPIVLTASRVVQDKGDLIAVINLKPAIPTDELDKRIQNEFSKNINKDFKNSLDDLLPRKLIDTIVKLSKIDGDKKVNLITREERKNLVNLLQNFTLHIKGLRPVEEAIVTAGGIDVKEINPSTMCSKIIDNLYFSGEVIDVDAYTGGYNIQIAMSTGYLAGKKVSEQE
jgi:predicted Rossmann fold flavoprotein